MVRRTGLGMTYHGADSKIESGGLVQHGHARHGEIMRLKILSSMTFILWLFAAAAGAQFLQYTPPGGPEQDPETRREKLEREYEEARFRFGAVRVAPLLSLRDVAYVRNSFASGDEPPDDFTATLGLGLRAFLRSGSKATWTAQVLPEYVWWVQQEDKRRLDGSYLLGFNGYFNRLTVEARAGRRQEQEIVTPEILVPVSTRRDGGELLLELRLTGATSVFTAASVDRQEILTEDLEDLGFADLERLERQERVLRAGLRWRPRQAWTLGVGAERSEVDFDEEALDRSNSGTAPVVEVRFEGNRLLVQADAAFRSLEAEQGALFLPYDRVTGNAFVSLWAGRALSPEIYFSRSLAYPLSSAYAYFEDERLGAALEIILGRRSRARLFVETGDNDYTGFSGLTPRREDDLSAYGGALSFGLHRNLSLVLHATRTSFDSNLPGFDRSYTTAGATINVLGLR
jgi:hypothetical protein